ncbi:MAG: response regulator [Planctomycetaceae bacterium]|jgi:CheY-like chemotaxis protein|nr:response regulator [Planctomycetaceae bacterium]
MPYRVLVIDDEKVLSQVLAIRLRAAGYLASTANSGLEGLLSAQESRPDAIVLDVRMPDMDGFEVHARLKQNPHLSAIPVVFLSANVQDSARHSALAAGASAYLTKPYDPHEVIATVHDAIVRGKGARSVAHA